MTVAADAPLPEVARGIVEAPKSLPRRVADRISDRLNPILVREVRQALNSKAFLVTSGLALLATVLVGLAVAWRGEDAAGDGRDVLTASLQILTPILIFIVPVQAFLSMRHEVTAGTVEHLLMSKLTPGQIVRGKLGAAVVQFVLYLSIFAPLLTMTFLLRGVDVPTIAYLIVMGFLFGVAACALAVACGALSRWPSIFRVLPILVCVGGLGMSAVGLMQAVNVLAREISSDFGDPEFLWLSVTIVLAVAAGTYLFGLVGAAALAHPYENRSTPFRLFAWIGTVLGFGWMTWMGSRPSFGIEPEMYWAYAFVLAPCLSLFPLFASTEEPRLSPRVRSRVPRRSFLALLAAPWLPGAGRGLIYSVLLAATTLGGAVGLIELTKPLAVSFGKDDYVREGALLGWLYVLFYCGIGAFVRRRLGPGPRATWIARAVPVLVMLLGILGPVLIEALLRVRHRSWQPYDILNPFLTIDESGGRNRALQITVLGVMTAVTVLLLGGRSMVRGLREVLEASRARRRRAD